MSIYIRAALLALVGLALEAGGVLALLFCYWLHHFIFVAVVLMVVAGSLFSLGVVSILYATVALGENCPASATKIAG